VLCSCKAKSRGEKKASGGLVVAGDGRFFDKAKSRRSLENEQSARSDVFARPSFAGKRRLLVAQSLRGKISLSQGEIALPFGKQTVREE